MDTRAIVILYEGKEVSEAMNIAIIGYLNEQGIISGSHPEIITADSNDIAKMLVKESISKTNVITKDPNKEEIGHALTYISGLYPKGITSEEAVLKTVTSDGEEHIMWVNAIKILFNNNISKATLAAHSVTNSTVNNIKKAYFTCAQAGRL